MHSKKEILFWKHKTHLFQSDEYICSGCHYVADKPYKTCPGCGSQMKRSKYDPSWVDESEMMDILLGD